MSACEVRNRIKRHVRVRAGDLVPHELNSRVHPEAQRQGRRWLPSSRDECSGEDLSDVAEGPADLGRRLPVVKGDRESRAARC